MIYAGASYATAMLEMLAHWNGIPPKNQHFVEIIIREGTSFEVVTPDTVPGWANPDGVAARGFGHAWYEEGRSAILIVPSVVARLERNVVINARHPEFAQLAVGPETPVEWDWRLFR